PFAHTTSRLKIIPSGNGIDVEEESIARLWDGLVFVRPSRVVLAPGRCASASECVQQRYLYLPFVPRRQLWTSAVFAREVQISGWTSVGMPRALAWWCVMKTKEGTLIHAHKRNSDIVAL
ncbi:hypothetical protein B0H13DRAFT_1541380, partial [Mycena leptocephala]